MLCKECGLEMKMFYDVEFIGSFIVYRCKCGHEKKFTKDETVIMLLEMLLKEC